MLENTPFLPGLLKDSSTASRGGRALHAVGWHDLTARINAARDLRELVKHDLVMGGASFTDAAAGYFAKTESAFEEGKQPVNQNALEGCKRSEGIGKNSDNSDGKPASEATQNEGDQEQ